VSVRTRVSELNYCWWCLAISFVLALTPFNDNTTTFWTSAGTTSTAQLGYSYPEFDGLDAGNADTVREAIARIVKDLYDPDVSGGTNATLGSTGSNRKSTDSNQKPTYSIQKSVGSGSRLKPKPTHEDLESTGSGSRPIYSPLHKNVNTKVFRLLW